MGSKKLLTVLRRGGGAPSIITDGLLAEWRFDDGSGQVLTDYSGNAKHGALGTTAGADTNDPVWGTEGLTFGTDDGVKVPELSSASNYTFQVALNPNAASSSSRFIFDAQTGRLIISATDSGGRASPSYYDGGWHYPNPAIDVTSRVIWTFILNSAGASVFSNLTGLTLDSSAYTQRAIGSTSAIGARYDVGASFIGADGDVLISYLAIYNRALFTSEWQANYAAIKSILSIREAAWGSLP